MEGFKFPKTNRLVAQKEIELTYHQGETIKKFPLLCKYMLLNETKGDALQVVFAVPKRKFKSAVKRNLLRRRLKEAFRKNQQTLKQRIEKQGCHLGLYIIYTSDELFEYQKLEEKLNVILRELSSKFNEK